MRLGALSLDLALNAQSARLDVLLSIVPGSARVRRGDGDLNSAHYVSREETTDTSRAKQEACGDRSAEDEDTWGDHALDRGLGGDSDAPFVVRPLTAISDARHRFELPLNLRYHERCSISYCFHGHRREGVWKHGSSDQPSELQRSQNVDDLHIRTCRESSKEG